jgi:glutathione S-transferase
VRTNLSSFKIRANVHGTMKNTKNDDLKFRVYGLTTFDRSAKVRWLLTELGVDFEFRLLDREKKEHEGPEFLKLTPMGRVPVLEFGDQVMFESGAICAYLSDLFLEKGMAPALDSKDRPAYEQWMYFASATVDVFQIRIMIIEDIPPGEVLGSKLAALQSDLRDAYVTLDMALDKNPFLLGNHFSTADLCVAYHLYWLSLWPELNEVITDFPRVQEYVKRVEKMPSAIKANVFSYKG